MHSRSTSIFGPPALVLLIAVRDSRRHAPARSPAPTLAFLRQRDAAEKALRVAHDRTPEANYAANLRKTGTIQRASRNARRGDAKRARSFLLVSSMSSSRSESRRGSRHAFRYTSIAAGQPLQRLAARGRLARQVDAHGAL